MRLAATALLTPVLLAQSRRVQSGGVRDKCPLRLIRARFMANYCGHLARGRPAEYGSEAPG